MGAFYGNKIKNGDINSKTEMPWELEDVPLFWRVRTEKWMQEN